MTSPAFIAAAGLVVGVLYGLFGVGSAFATPMLALLGVPGAAAVSVPLPAMLPGSATGAWSYSKAGKVDWYVARRTAATALPAAVWGAYSSQWFSKPVLMVLSGLVLGFAGVRILRPVNAATTRQGWAQEHPVALMTLAAIVGWVSGLLANGGGFLLVPMFLLLVGLDMNRATGTSLVVATLLTIPTLITRAWIGDIEWSFATVFAVGMVPGARLGAVAASRLAVERLRSAFGVLMLVFAVWFLVRELAPLF